MFDGLQVTCLIDVTSNTWHLLSVEVYMELTAKSEIPVCNQ